MTAMLLLIWTIVALFGFAVVVDQLMSEQGVRTWRESTRDFRKRMDKLDSDAAIATTHGMFCSLFDAIYGSRYRSAKRFLRSYYSSLLALCTVTLLVGWQSTVFGRVRDSVGTDDFFMMIAGVSLAVLVLNPCADYISLQETRWILGRNKNPSPAMLALLGVIDLAATFVIFNLGFLILGKPFSYIFDQNFNFDALYKMNEGLIFLASTFFTSALWLAYMTSALSIRVMKRNWRVVRLFVEVVGETDTPARTTAAFIAILLVAIYGFARVGLWAGEMV